MSKEPKGTKARQSSGPPSSLTPGQKVDIAILYLSGQSQEQLSEAFGIGKTTVHRAIQDAIKQKHISVRVHLDEASSPRVLTDVGNKVAKRFGIERVFVVQNEGEAPPSIHTLKYALWSDRQHRLVGRQMGKHLEHAITADSRVGVASGRGVFYAIQGLLKQQGRLQTQRVALCSLTGSFGMRAQSELGWMDGDSNVCVLSLAFDHDVAARTVGKDLGDGGASTIETFSEPPDYALVGVGVAEPHNRLFHPSVGLERIRQTLSEIQELSSSSLQRWGYSPVADTCNHLFYVPPPPNVPVRSSDHDRLKSLVERANEGLCSISLRQLGRVRSIWMSAATAIKAPAVFACLNERLPIRALCIDSALATRLLEIAA